MKGGRENHSDDWLRKAGPELHFREVRRPHDTSNRPVERVSKCEVFQGGRPLHSEDGLIEIMPERQVAKGRRPLRSRYRPVETVPKREVEQGRRPLTEVKMQRNTYVDCRQSCEIRLPYASCMFRCLLRDSEPLYLVTGFSRACCCLALEYNRSCLSDACDAQMVRLISLHIWLHDDKKSRVKTYLP